MGFAQPDVEYDYTTCCNCGVSFGSPVVAFRRKDGKDIWCPNGHGQSWRKSEADKLREQLAAKEIELKAANSQKWAAEQKHALSVQALNKLEKEKKRLAKRVANGVCPCCNRHFVNVERHMKTKHPEQTGNLI